MNTKESTETPEHDYEGYAKALEKILDGATKDYWTGYVDISRHQLNVSRTYLWVSAALLGIYGTAYEKFHDHLLNSNLFFIALSLISFVLCCVGFGLCLYAIPARKGYKPIFDTGWGEFTHQAYGLLEKNDDKIYPTFLTSFISKIDSAIAYNFSTNSNRAKQLRLTSWILISSFLLAIIVALSITTQTTHTYLIKKDTIMNNAPQNTQTENTKQEPTQKLKVPVPPPPAQIIKSNLETYVFDSATPQTISTESYKEK